jgi:hydrogenase/urease accessory protein HupE
MTRRLLLAVALVTLRTPAAAHQGGISYADVSIDVAQVTLAVHVAYADWAPLIELDANRDGVLTSDEARQRLQRLGAIALSRIAVETRGQRCAGSAVDAESGTRLGAAFVTLWLIFRCPTEIEDVRLQFALLEREHPGHRTLATVYDRVTKDATLREHVFGPGTETLDFARARGARTSQDAIRQFVGLGIEHIFTGYDHILFLLGLLLVAEGFTDLLKIVTSFTIAHTLTLVLATLGYVHLNVRLVESVIALSIAWVAVENLVAREHRRRWLLSFVFGLVHGFGFSNVLREMTIPRDVLAWSLASFNVGVELGQVAIVALLYPALVWSRRQRWSAWAVRTASAAIGLMGLYWFVERALLGA